MTSIYFLKINLDFISYDKSNTGNVLLTKTFKNNIISSKHSNYPILHSIHFARYLASIHVIAGHFYVKGFNITNLDSLKHMTTWGFSWVPFFFILY